VIRQAISLALACAVLGIVITVVVAQWLSA
jgi:hypothetical protein